MKKKYFVFLIIYLTIISSYLTFFSLAKYTYKNNINGSKGIAKFEVNFTPGNNPEKISINADNSLNNYIFTVKSKSDTAVKYSVIVSNIPDGIKVAIDNGALTSPTNGSITFENIGTLPTSTVYTENQHTLVLSAIPEIDDISEYNINMDIIFSQINPNI